MRIFKTLLTIAGIIGLLSIGTMGYAKATGACSNCHTMHNSQNGSAVESGGPYSSLTKGNCIGCHTGTNNGSNSIPYVLDTSAPTYNFDGSKNTLAGGNFYWVASSYGATDSKGHNVSGLASSDSNISNNTPPGFNSTDYTANGTVGSTWSSNQLTCAGTYGCHGDHSKSGNYAAISGAHHTDDTTIDGSSVGKSFRFLYGIKGTEDSDWEYTTSSSDHNGYWANDYQTSGTIDTYSINYLCAECHGNFHKHSSIDDSTSGSPWLRHPTDFDMNNVSSDEYGSYPNATLFSSVSTAGDYFPDVPVGNTGGTVKSSVLAASGDAVVLCISCHRAHGSPYADLLRWDYSTCTAGSASANCGCFACHTGK